MSKYYTAPLALTEKEFLKFRYLRKKYNVGYKQVFMLGLIQMYVEKGENYEDDCAKNSKTPKQVG